MKGIKLSPGASEYLFVDDRRTSALRARLRHDRSSLKASLADRRVEPSPNCPTCGVPEDNDHCVLICPNFAIPRLRCTTRLSRIGQPLKSSAVALGDTEWPAKHVFRLPDNVQRELLIITGEYLRDIDNLRRL